MEKKTKDVYRFTEEELLKALGIDAKGKHVCIFNLIGKIEIVIG